MINEKKKMTAQGSSVGADDGQSISQNSKTTIPDPDEKSNSPGRDLEELYRKMRRMSDPAYLHTVTLDELMDNVFEGKSAVIENLLYTGAYILAGAPKIGKSFLVAQIAHHVSSGQDLWGYKVHQGTVLYLALEKPPDPLLSKLAAVIAGDTPVWNGSATELVALLGEDMQPNILTRRLNVKAGELLNEHGIEYTVKRTRSGSFISLARKAV